MTLTTGECAGLITLVFTLNACDAVDLTPDTGEFELTRDSAAQLLQDRSAFDIEYSSGITSKATLENITCHETNGKLDVISLKDTVKGETFKAGICEADISVIGGKTTHALFLIRDNGDVFAINFDGSQSISTDGYTFRGELQIITKEGKMNSVPNSAFEAAVGNEEDPGVLWLQVGGAKFTEDTGNSSVLSDLVSLISQASGAKADQPTPSSVAPVEPELEASPTPAAEVKLKGLVADIWKFPKITEAQELEHIQKAIETTSLNLDPGDIYNIQLFKSQLKDEDVGSALRIVCTSDVSCIIRDSYQVKVQTPEGDFTLNKILVEVFGTFEDDTRGSVIIPVILDADNTYGTGSYEKAAQSRLDDLIHNIQLFNTIDFSIFTGLTSTDASNPNIIDAWLQNSMDPEINVLLEKANQLASDGKILTQSEWLKLIHASVIFKVY